MGCFSLAFVSSLDFQSVMALCCLFFVASLAGVFTGNANRDELGEGKLGKKVLVICLLIMQPERKRRPQWFSCYRAWDAKTLEGFDLRSSRRGLGLPSTYLLP